MNAVYEEAAAAIRGAKCAVAVTGAGVSEESGIPTFRGTGGIWEKYSPEEYATLEAYLVRPQHVWRFWVELAVILRDCQPNPAHVALAQLEEYGRLEAVITQNVDNLHQTAGSRNVIEYHGNARKLVCLQCHAGAPFSVEQAPTAPPRCTRCRGVMKPDVVMFGELIPKYALYESDALAQKCDVMIVVGTSAQVYPAAGLPFTAKQHGAYIIEANTEPTEFTDTVTDAFLEGPCGTTLPRLVKLVASGPAAISGKR